MGLSDRDYTQKQFSGKKRRPRRTGGRSVVVFLIFLNFALWLANGLLFENDELSKLLLLREGAVFVSVESEASVLPNPSNTELQKKLVINPAQCYRFLTYGFVHSPADWSHIVFNMIGLMMFGYGMMLGIGPSGFGFVRSENIEHQLGRLEFTAFYFLTIIIGGVVFALINLDEPRAGVLGASGGVSGVVILYAWLFPRKTLFLWGILPLPVWALGIFIVYMDALGASGALGDGIAYPVHLAGAAFGTFYYFCVFKQGWQLTGWLHFSSRPKRKPKLRVYTPEDSPPKPSLSDEEFNRRLDDILQRFGEVGESGLTSEEREFLQRAVQKFAAKHRK